MKTAKPSSRRPARRASLKPSPLNGYLAGAASTAALLGAPQAEAAVTAVNFGFGATLTTGAGSLGSNTVGPGYGILAVGSNPSDTNLGTGNPSNGQIYAYNLVSAYQGLAKFFNVGAVIGDGTHGTLGQGFFNQNGTPGLIHASTASANIGFKTSTNHYGYANVSWDATLKTLTVNHAFVQSNAGSAITITAVPEPSRALLALAGFGAMALRRRRKQAA